MPDLILTDDQASALADAFGPVPVRDRQGNVVGRFEPSLTPRRVAELKREAASSGPWYTGDQVQARFRSLQEEWDRSGGFDEAQLDAILKRLDAADPGYPRSTGEAG